MFIPEADLLRLTGFVEVPPDLRGLAKLHDSIHQHMDATRFGAPFESIRESSPASPPSAATASPPRPPEPVDADVERMTKQVRPSLPARAALAAALCRRRVAAVAPAPPRRHRVRCRWCTSSS